MRELDNFYARFDEPVQSCFLALKDIILSCDNDVSEAWKYNLPFFCYKGKMFCYLWLDKKRKQPYIGFVEGNKIDHADLLQEKRSRMKILLINPEEDIEIRKIKGILKTALDLYRNGNIRIKIKKSNS